MRFLIMIKASAASEAGGRVDPAVVAAMTAFHEDLARAGVLLDAAGLQPSVAGWRVRQWGEQREILPGPFPLTDDLLAGYTLIQARDAAEALEWSRRYPNPVGAGMTATLEVRPLYGPEDFAALMS